MSKYNRILTKEVKVGTLYLGAMHPIRVQTMTTTDTMDTKATVAQSIRCIEAGAELVRITAPSLKEAQNLELIKNEIRKAGFSTPLVADIHFTPNAAELAARIVEKVRINPGNYADKKKFEFINYTDSIYQEELDRIRKKFVPLIKICKEYGTAMRIGTNHGSLSDRIMSRFGDTAIGMVESALEFLRIAADENYHNIVLSMKSSNPIVMVEAYRLLAVKMQEEFSYRYPLHLGVTEAGDGDDGRIKSAIGIGTLLKEGLGDTIRVSLTEDPEYELPVCKQIIEATVPEKYSTTEKYRMPQIQVQKNISVQNIGGEQVPVVIADVGKIEDVNYDALNKIGLRYDAKNDKWNIEDSAPDFLFVNEEIKFALPGTIKLITWYDAWKKALDKKKVFPYLSQAEYLLNDEKSDSINFIDWPSNTAYEKNLFEKILKDTSAVLVIYEKEKSIAEAFSFLQEHKISNPTIMLLSTKQSKSDKQLIEFAIEAGSNLLQGNGNGIITGIDYALAQNMEDISRNNATAFSILQSTRKRISKTEYISCPSCGRTLFDLQETTAAIRAKTNHLKGVKIAIMGCIVNGPGEMADADFGYVGSGVGKITLYKGKEVVKRAIPSEVAVDALIDLLKENNAWVEKTN